MKPQVKCRSYGQFSRNNVARALICALGIIPFIASPTMAYAVADPVVESSTVKPDAAGIYDFTNDKNVQNPFPNVITPDEVRELQNTAKSVRPLPSIQKIFYTPYGKKFSVENGQAFGDTKSINERLSIHIMAGLEELTFSYFSRGLIKKAYIPVMVNFIHTDHPAS